MWDDWPPHKLHYKWVSVSSLSQPTTATSERSEEGRGGGRYPSYQVILSLANIRVIKTHCTLVDLKSLLVIWFHLHIHVYAITTKCSQWMSSLSKLQQSGRWLSIYYARAALSVKSQNPWAKVESFTVRMWKSIERLYLARDQRKACLRAWHSSLYDTIVIFTFVTHLAAQTLLLLKI